MPKKIGQRTPGRSHRQRDLVNDEILALHFRFAAKVQRYVASQFPDDAALVDDLCQDIWLRVTGGVRLAPSSTNARAWLESICRHVCIDRIRQRQRDRRIFTPIDSPRTLRPPDAAEAATEIVEIDAIADEVVKLPPRARAVAVASFWFDRTPAEIAREYHMSAGGVRKALFEARARLRKSLRRGSGL